ncbi:MAG: lytic transglycosylase domain-containing protein [Alphaproteobacteria bacterium]|nr:lytic transglycosylase domain-containing protein [Alphaproteobacteria bacterium]
MAFVPASGVCRAAAVAIEAETGLPAHLLISISRTETGRRTRSGASLGAWPWTLHAEGESYYFETREEAVAAARRLEARGVRSIDVGCMQINLMHHPDAFAALEEAFDPLVNVAYAAGFLRDLKARYGSWEQAVARYHSADPERYEIYEARVARVMEEERSAADSCAAAPLGPALPPAATGSLSSPCPRRPTILTALSDRPAEDGAPVAGTGQDAPRLRLVAFGAYDWL